MLKTVSRLILSAILLVFTGLFTALAHYVPDLIFSWYGDLSRQVLRAIGLVTAALPFSLVEILLILLILWLLYSFIGIFRHKTSLCAWLAGLIEGASLLVFLFMSVWGLNYFSSDTVGDRIGLDVRQYSVEELQSATEYYLNQANQYAQRMERDENGLTQGDSFRELAEHTAVGYEVLAAQYDCFIPSVQTPKPVIASLGMSYSGISGIFFCLTSECNINDDGPVWTLPFTMCHERAHAQGIAPENECNFVGYLAAVNSGDNLICYSGYYHALIYCYNALYKQDKEAAAAIWAAIDPGLTADIRASNAHYKQFEGEVQKAAEKVNDTYLKVMEQPSGVQSYGEVVDYLIAWHLAGGL